MSVAPAETLLTTLDTTPLHSRNDTEHWIEKAAITEVVQAERAARDQVQWDRMRSCFHPDAAVSISWFQGPGGEFVAASQRLYERGVRSLHHMATSLVRIEGDRALAETGFSIMLHGEVGGVKAFITSYSRLFSRVERRGGEWRISGLRVVYLFDHLTASNPTEALRLDSARLESYRPSYRYVCYLLAEGGQTPNPDLPGADRPESVLALLAAEEAWLSRS